MASFPNLWFCGDSGVDLFSTSDHPDPGQPVWGWNAETARELSAEARGWFRYMDDVKPVVWRGEACVLVTSSGEGGVALIRRADRRVLFAAAAGAAHSAELLPGDVVAVACSDSKHELIFFRVAENVLAGEAVMSIAFQDAHGVVFDVGNRLLWVVGAKWLAAFQVDPVSFLPGPEAKFWLVLPDIQAHELLPDPHGGGLIVSTQHAVWRFDLATREIAPFAPLARIPDVKSVSVEAKSGVIAFSRGEGGQWWSENIYLLTPEGHLQMCTCRGRHLYKVRWDQSCQV